MVRERGRIMNRENKLVAILNYLINNSREVAEMFAEYGNYEASSLHSAIADELMDVLGLLTDEDYLNTTYESIKEVAV